LCQGQLLPIEQYQAVFSVLGTTYGGDGEETFALPDLTGRVPVGAGNGRDGLSSYDLGEETGSETVPLVASEVASGSGAAVATTPAAAGSNVQPVLGLNYVICLEGLYPTRP
jgi:microcystin-dependent protein